MFSKVSLVYEEAFDTRVSSAEADHHRRILTHMAHRAGVDPQAAIDLSLRHVGRLLEDRQGIVNRVASSLAIELKLTGVRLGRLLDGARSRDNLAFKFIGALTDLRRS